MSSVEPYSQPSQLIEGQDLVESLNNPETKIRRDNVQPAYKATFHWLFDPQIVSFSDWLGTGNEHAQPFYWIQGKPGSGKSTLMKFAMNDSRMLHLLGDEPDLPWTVVSFFFHDIGRSPIQKSLRGLLQEIIYCILTKLPQLTTSTIALYREIVKAQNTKSPTWELKALTALMHKILGQRETRIRLMIMLDALDEHEGDNEQLVQMLQDWTNRADGYYVELKICLASRSWPELSDQFGRYPNLAIHQHTENDIRIYTESRLIPSPGGAPQLLPEESLDFLIRQITIKAQGVFIWVRLVAEEVFRCIRDGTPFQTLQAKVAESPKELQELYEHTLRRIRTGYGDENYIMFQMLLCSIRPLPLETLIQATGFSLQQHANPVGVQQQETPPAPHCMSLESELRWLACRSGGLLEPYEIQVANSSDKARDEPAV